MRAFISTVAFLAVAAPQAFAGLYITAPVVTTSCAAGQNCPLAWNDDGQPPSLSQIGACNVGLFVGSVSTQYLLQSISAAFDVSKAGTLNFSPDPSVGANSNQYFIRFTSNTLNSTTNTGYPYQAFSAKFTLTGMTGQFNSTVQQVMSASGPLTTALSTSGGVQSTVSGASITSSGSGSKVITSTTSIKGSSTSSPTTSSASHSGGAVKLVAAAGSSAAAIAVVSSLVVVAVSGFFTAL